MYNHFIFTFISNNKFISHSNIYFIWREAILFFFNEILYDFILRWIFFMLFLKQRIFILLEIHVKRIEIKIKFFEYRLLCYFLCNNFTKIGFFSLFHSLIRLQNFKNYGNEIFLINVSVKKTYLHKFKNTNPFYEILVLWLKYFKL
jgi:hypothetical protein